jgi:hypothetical protein
MSTHKPYHERSKHPHDFVVEYHILTHEEGGRKMPVYQGIRWDFWYEYEGHEDNFLFMIWPEFLDDNGMVITSTEKPVPANGQARMWIVTDKMRKYHQDKIHVGMKGFAHEGPKVVATYIVKELTGLLTNPTVDNDE